MNKNNQIGETNNDFDVEMKYNPTNWDLQERRISKTFTELPNDNENEFNDVMQKLFDYNAKEDALDAIAMVPSLLFQYFKENNVTNSFSMREKILLIGFGHYISWYRKQMKIKQSLVDKLFNQFTIQKKQIEKMEKDFCFHLQHIECKEPSDVLELLAQEAHLKHWQDKSSKITDCLQIFLNVEERRLAELLYSHGEKNEKYMILYQKYICEKYEQWLKRDKKIIDIPENHF